MKISKEIVIRNFSMFTIITLLTIISLVLMVSGENYTNIKTMFFNVSLNTILTLPFIALFFILFWIIGNNLFDEMNYDEMVNALKENKYG